MTRACFLCQGEGRPFSRFSYWADHELDLVWCDRCDIGWVPKLPEQSLFVEGYERMNVLSWADKTPRALQKDIRRAYLKGFRVGSEFVRHWRGTSSSGLRVLEVGSNIGAVLKGVMDRLGLAPSQVVGVDFSRNHAEISESKFGIQTHADTLDAIAGRLDGKFDLILCHHIIEHDDDPVRFLSMLTKLLKPDGIVSFELPNGFREARCIQADEQRGVRFNTTVNHINYFSPRGFRRLLRRQGFQVRHLSTLNANDLLHDLGWWRHPARTAAPLRLSDVQNRSVLDVFQDEPIQQGIQSARRVARFIPFVHRRLRMHYPVGVPWGRDIEAIVVWEGKGAG